MVIDRVPLLNISPFVEGSETGKQDVARRIAEACESIGFFAISGHGVATETIEVLRRVSHDFFSRPVEEKLRAEHPVTGTPRRRAHRLRHNNYPDGRERTREPSSADTRRALDRRRDAARVLCHQHRRSDDALDQRWLAVQQAPCR